MLRLPILCRWPEGGGRPEGPSESAGAEAAKEALITSSLNKREKAELNTLLRRLMIEFERREDA